MLRRRRRRSNHNTSRVARAMLLAALTVGSPALADGPTEREGQLAAEAFAAGKAAFARSDFVAAAKSFEDAALRLPHPAALMNAAEAWELAGKRARAAELCDLVLAMKALEAPFRDAATAQLAKLTPRIATLEVVEPAGGLASINGAPSAQIPFRRRLEPGTHKVVVLSGPGRPERSEVIEIAAGEVRSYRPTSLVTLGPPSHGVWPPPTSTWVAFGGAAAFATVGSIFGVRTLAAQDAFDANPTFDTRDDFYRDRLVSNVSFAVAGAALIASAVLWFVQSRHAETSAASTTSPTGYSYAGYSSSSSLFAPDRMR